MRIFLLFSLLFPAFASAFCENYSRYGTPERICWKNELKAYVNGKCESECLARKFTAKKNARPVLRLSGGKNPASALCGYAELKVVVLTDPRGAGQSFCEFSDGSLMDSNAVARSFK